MTFSNFQIFTIFISFLLAFIIALIWQFRDKNVDTKSNEESLSVLMSIFFWSAFLAFFLKLGLDLLKNYNFSLINTKSFFYFTLLLEELVKAFALVLWLEIAWKRFNEISDWVVYWVMSALWFIFFENIFYVLSSWYILFSTEYLSLFIQRNIFSFSAHLTIVLFSTLYAMSYIKSWRLKKWNRPKPWHFPTHFRLLWHWSVTIWFLYFLLSPIILIIKYITRKKPKLSIMLYWSFFISVILHITYDEFISIWWLFSILTLIVTAFIWFIIFRRFDKLDI